MGKNFITCAIFLAALAPQLAFSRKNNRPFFSEEKKILRQKKREQVSKAKRKKPMPDESFSRELREKAQETPWASRFYSRTVFYYRSTARIPETYNCDGEIEKKKKAEAEAQALQECENSGLSDCQLAKVLIAKNGILRCQDFPGHRCPGSGHYRGCVAEALALGDNRKIAPPSLLNEEASTDTESEL